MKHLPIAVLISGGGTTLANLIKCQAAGELPVDFQIVISSSPSAKGLQFATDSDIPTHVFSRKDFGDPESHSDKVFELCRERGVELVVMGGYLEHLVIPEDFENRVVNIHPSLIPSFSGKGFYGMRVHQAAIARGVKISGCTVHFVNNEFDSGPIIAQRYCSVFNNDTPETLQQRVFDLECHIYPAAIAAIANGQVEVIDGGVHLHTII